jgi:hypothetical protein
MISQCRDTNPYLQPTKGGKKAHSQWGYGGSQLGIGVSLVSKVCIEPRDERRSVGQEEAAIDAKGDHGEGVAEDEFANSGQHRQQPAEADDASTVVQLMSACLSNPSNLRRIFLLGLTLDQHHHGSLLPIPTDCNLMASAQARILPNPYTGVRLAV